jgi:hypothetical protein
MMEREAPAMANYYRLQVGPRKLGQRQAYVSERCSGLMAMWRSRWLPFRSRMQMPYR